MLFDHADHERQVVPVGILAGYEPLHAILVVILPAVVPGFQLEALELEDQFNLLPIPIHHREVVDVISAQIRQFPG